MEIMWYFKGTMHARRGTTSFTSTAAGRNLKCILKINETKFNKKRFFTGNRHCRFKLLGAVFLF